jgi:hypothetical protein
LSFACCHFRFYAAYAYHLSFAFNTAHQMFNMSIVSHITYQLSFLICTFIYMHFATLYFILHIIYHLHFMLDTKCLTSVLYVMQHTMCINITIYLRRHSNNMIMVERPHIILTEVKLQNCYPNNLPFILAKKKKILLL